MVDLPVVLFRKRMRGPRSENWIQRYLARNLYSSAMARLAILLPSILLLVACGSPSYNDPVPEHDSFTIASQRLGETRTINVWVPPVYADGTTRLPVLYMPDGGIVGEDFPHIANTLAELIEAQRIRPIMLVGIANTDRKRDLTGPSAVATDQQVAPTSGGAENFRSFISEELFPEIDRRYRTTVEKGLIGESLAGLFTTETFLVHPELFNFYIAFDPSLWWNGTSLAGAADNLLKRFPQDPKRFWFASSSAEDIAPVAAQLAEDLKAYAPANVQWTYVPMPKEKHNTIFRAAKTQGIEWAVGK